MHNKRLKQLRKRLKELSKLNSVLEYHGNQITVITQSKISTIKSFDFDEMKKKYIINPSL